MLVLVKLDIMEMLKQESVKNVALIASFVYILAIAFSVSQDISLLMEYAYNL